MFYRYLSALLLFAHIGTLYDHAIAQAAPAPGSQTAVTFALWPLGHPPHSPVAFEGLVLGGKRLGFDQALTLPLDWPAQLAVRLRNVSTKPITYVRLNLSFPETASGNTPPYPFGVQVHLGNQIPVHGVNQKGESFTRQQVAPLLWEPNAEVEIPLSDVAGTLAAAARLHETVTRVEVILFGLQFQDVSMWDGSYWSCQQDGSHCVATNFSDFVRE
jgi:hypothetical protein